MYAEEYIHRKLEKHRLHFSLIDPDPKKVDAKKIEKMAKMLEKAGSDLLLIGGSTGVTENVLDDAIKIIKKHFTRPVVLYPGSAQGLSQYADAILFMSLLNSTDPLWISGMQVIGAPHVKKYNIEPIPMAYLIVEPGMKAGEVGKAKLLKKPEEAVAYALTAQYLGMRFVYLEAGSGAHTPVSNEIIQAVRKEISVPLIVGGGIRDAKTAVEKLKAGADIIVTGTIIEDDSKRVKSIIDAIHKFRD